MRTIKQLSEEIDSLAIQTAEQLSAEVKRKQELLDECMDFMKQQNKMIRYLMEDMEVLRAVLESLRMQMKSKRP